MKNFDIQCVGNQAVITVNLSFMNIDSLNRIIERLRFEELIQNADFSADKESGDNMISGIRQQTVVGKGGKIEIVSPELPVGKKVEVFVWTEFDEQDTTEYLLSNETNRNHLLQAVKDLEDKSSYIYSNFSKL